MGSKHTTRFHGQLIQSWGTPGHAQPYVIVEVTCQSPSGTVCPREGTQVISKALLGVNFRGHQS